MNKLQKKLLDKPSNLINIYCTAGYPNKDSLLKIVPALAESGADMAEIGIPYSDPLADGTTIQQSSAQALRNGMTLELIFQQLKQLEVDVPLILMGYFNSVLQYGIARFCEECVRSGVSGVILPDVPLNYYEEHLEPLFDSYELSMIFLVSPQTSEERRKQIDAKSSAFIYAVSSSSTTGKSTGIQDAVPYLQSLSSLHHPVMVGFNISSNEDVEIAHAHSAGAIIGSAFIRNLDPENEAESTREFMSNIIETSLV